MYKIYADRVAIHDTSTRDSQVIKPELVLEDNMAGSLEFTMPVSHPMYGKLNKLTTWIKVYQESLLIFTGRIIEEKKDFMNNISYYCEGDLAFLNDTTQPQAVYHGISVKSFLEALLNNHNYKVERIKQFNVGVVTVTDSNDSLYRYTNRENTLECIKDKLLERLGGHLRVRIDGVTRYLDYLADYPNTNTQVIRFGENLLDYTEENNLSEIYTVLIPLGAKLETQHIEGLDDYVDITSVNGGRDYLVNDEAVKKYGWIEHVEHFDDITVPSNLMIKGLELLSSINYDEMVLEVSAVDLHDLDIDTEAIKLLDKIRVVSEVHGLDAYFPVTKISIPLDNPADKKFTLGVKTTKAITDTNTIGG
jgi:phage minor structural protein